MASGDNRRFWFLCLPREFMLDDDTVDYILTLPDVDGYQLMFLYLQLCELTLQSDGRLVRELGNKTIPFTAEYIARACKWHSVETVANALTIFCDVGLLSPDADGVLCCTLCAGRVYSVTQAAIEKRKQREKMTADNVRTMSGTMSGQLTGQCPDNVRDNVSDNVRLCHKSEVISQISKSDNSQSVSQSAREDNGQTDGRTDGQPFDGVDNDDDGQTANPVLQQIRDNQQFVDRLREAATTPADGDKLPSWLDRRLKSEHIDELRKLCNECCGGDVRIFEYALRQARQYDARSWRYITNTLMSYQGRTYDDICGDDVDRQEAKQRAQARNDAAFIANPGDYDRRRYPGYNIANLDDDVPARQDNWVF